MKEEPKEAEEDDKMDVEEDKKDEKKEDPKPAAPKPDVPVPQPDAEPGDNEEEEDGEGNDVFFSMIELANGAIVEFGDSDTADFKDVVEVTMEDSSKEVLGFNRTKLYARLRVMYGELCMRKGDWMTVHKKGDPLRKVLVEMTGDQDSVCLPHRSNEAISITPQEAVDLTAHDPDNERFIDYTVELKPLLFFSSQMLRCRVVGHIPESVDADNKFEFSRKLMIRPAGAFVASDPERKYLAARSEQMKLREKEGALNDQEKTKDEELSKKMTALLNGMIGSAESDKEARRK